MDLGPIAGWIDGIGGTLSATIDGHAATFDGKTWSVPGQPGIEEDLNWLTAMHPRFTIDATAKATLSFYHDRAKVLSFTREQFAVRGDRSGVVS